MNDKFLDDSNWFTVCGASDRAFAVRVQERVGQRIASGKYSENDTRQVGELHHLGGQGTATVSPEALQQLRRLCQLWDIDLKPTPNITSHRKIIGPLIVLMKRLAFPIVRFFMRETLRQQRDFNAAVLEAVARITIEQSRRSSP